MGNSWSESPIERIFREAWQRRCPHIRLEQEYKVRVSNHTYYIDFAHPATKTAIELDSYKFHGRTPDQYNNTVERSQDLTRAGWHVYPITGRQINNRVDQCVDDVRMLIETRARAQDIAREAPSQVRNAAPPLNPQPRTPPTPKPQSTAASPPFTPPPPSNTQYHYVLHEVTHIYEPGVSPAAAVPPTTVVLPIGMKQNARPHLLLWELGLLTLWGELLKLLAFTSSGAAAVMLGVAGFGVLVPLGGVETIPYLNVTSNWLIIALPVLCLVLVLGICSVVYRRASAVWRQVLALGWIIASVTACVGVYMLLNQFAEIRISLESVRNLVLLGVGVGALISLPHHSSARIFRSIGCVTIGVGAVLLVSCLAVSIGLRWVTTPTTRPAPPYRRKQPRHPSRPPKGSSVSRRNR